MIEVRKDIFLKDYSTFKIGGRAKYFVFVESISQLREAIDFAKEKKVPFFIIGGGSNILFSDNEYKGLIIKNQNSKIKIQKYNSRLKIFCGAGTSLIKLVFRTSEIGAVGLEWAAGIPGTIGGAVFGNAGALGGEIKNVLKTVKILNIRNLNEEIFDWSKCKFSYRSSVFKERIGEFIIFEVEINLKKGNGEKIKEKIDKNILYRKNHQPLNFPSAGSIFKNIELSDDLIKKFPEFKKFEDKIELSRHNRRGVPFASLNFIKAKSGKSEKFDSAKSGAFAFRGNKIPAAYLIDKCGLKKKTIGGAQVSEKQPNFILNVGNAKAEDVLNLINLITEKVKNKFGILLEREIRIIEPVAKIIKQRVY